MLGLGFGATTAQLSLLASISSECLREWFLFSGGVGWLRSETSLLRKGGAGMKVCPALLIVVTLFGVDR